MPIDHEDSSENEVIVHKVRRRQLDEHVSDDSDSTDDGGEESDMDLTPTQPEPTVSVIRKRPVRSIVQLSSDEEEEKVVHEWGEEDDAKLKACFEEYKEMVDPWSMIVYDSYFMERNQSKEVILKRARELGLKTDETEEHSPKRRRVLLDDSD